MLWAFLLAPFFRSDKSTRTITQRKNERRKRIGHLVIRTKSGNFRPKTVIIAEKQSFCVF